MNTHTLPLPVKYLGGLIAAVVLGLVIYLGAAVSVYVIAWVVKLITVLAG